MTYHIDELRWSSERSEGRPHDLTSALKVALVQTVPNPTQGLPDLGILLEATDEPVAEHWAEGDEIQIEFGLSDHDGTVQGSAKIVSLGASKQTGANYRQAFLWMEADPEVYGREEYPEVLKE